MNTTNGEINRPTTQPVLPCTLANREIYHHYGSRASCVYSTGVVCEVLTHFGFQAEPIRVETGLFHDDPKSYGCVLGSSGDGTRRPSCR